MKITTADGVFQGGGVKGLALVGALLEFAQGNEQIAIEQWVNVAGTSAGAIVAALLAVDCSVEQLKQLIDEMPYRDFEDWGPGGKIFGGALNLVQHHGLAHGKVFEDWLERQLEGKTFADVRRDSEAPADKTDDPYRLRMIAADVTNRRMLVLPADLALYRRVGEQHPIDPDAFKIAEAVRMSMSIPYFFQPVELEDLETGQPSTIVDGGVLSNFPVWLFDTDARAPVRPTFGLHLTGGKDMGGGLEQIVGRLGWPAKLGSDIFHTSTNAWDKRFSSHSTNVRTCSISAGAVATTEFSLGEAQKRELLGNGKDAARKFLEQFDIASYINTFGNGIAPPATQ